MRLVLAAILVLLMGLARADDLGSDGGGSDGGEVPGEPIPPKKQSRFDFGCSFAR